MTGRYPSTGFEVKGHDLRIADLPLRAGASAGAAVAVRERDAAEWEKHDIRQAGFWTTLIGKSSQEITYMLAWDSLAECEKRWGAFPATEHWRQGRRGHPVHPTIQLQTGQRTLWLSVGDALP
jgi:NIPSNAP